MIIVEYCKCDNKERVEALGDRYVFLYCRKCNQYSGPYLNKKPVEILQQQNESNEDKFNSFLNNLKSCESIIASILADSVKDTLLKKKPFPMNLFKEILREKK